MKKQLKSETIKVIIALVIALIWIAMSVYRWNMDNQSIAIKVLTLLAFGLDGLFYSENSSLV